MADPWISSGTVTLTGAGTQEGPAIIALANGNTAVAWVELVHDDVNGGWASVTVKAQILDPSGVPLTPVVSVSPPDIGHTITSEIHLAPLADGGFVALWEKEIPATYAYYGGPAPILQTPPEHEMWAQRVDANGTPVGDPFRFDSGTHYGGPEHFDVTPLAFGGFAVDWIARTAGVSGHTVQLFDAAGNPSGASYQVGETADMLRGTLLDVAATPYGGLAVVWDEHTADQPWTSNLIRYEHFDSHGVALDAPQWAGDQPGYYVQSVGSAGLGDGRTAVVEAIYPGSGSEFITVAVFDAHDTAIAAMQFDAEPGQLEVTNLAGGGFLVSWVTILGDQLDAQRFDDFGHPIGSTIVVAQAPATGWIASMTGNESRFDVTATADGGATFVWDWAGGSSDNVSDVRMAHWGPAGGGIVPAPGPAPIPVEPPNLVGTPGADRLVGTLGNDTLVGGTGTDLAVYTGAHTQYGVFLHGDDTMTLSGPNGTDLLSSVERLQFSDVSVAFDVTGNAGMAYRLYEAAFHRAPELAGLGYYIYHLDHGVPFALIAEHFIESPEFQSLYGNAVSDTQFITLLYENVLHREPEPAGLQFHLDEFAMGQTRADMLMHFSESPENQANLLGQMRDGMLYTPLV